MRNHGDGAAPASRTRYYLSANRERDGADLLLTGTSTVKSLEAGAAAAGSITLTAPSTTPAGTYVLLACADDLGVVSELVEANNCYRSAGRVTIGP